MLSKCYEIKRIIIPNFSQSDVHPIKEICFLFFLTIPILSKTSERACTRGQPEDMSTFSNTFV